MKVLRNFFRPRFADRFLSHRRADVRRPWVITVPRSLAMPDRPADDPGLSPGR